MWASSSLDQFKQADGLAWGSLLNSLTVFQQAEIPF